MKARHRSWSRSQKPPGQAFQRDDVAFNGFSSKYDSVLAGKAELTAQEARGLALFNDAAKGNCAACHPSEKSADGKPPLFTDFSYDNLSVPRNPEIIANRDPTYFDLGPACIRVKTCAAPFAFPHCAMSPFVRSTFTTADTAR